MFWSSPELHGMAHGAPSSFHPSPHCLCPFPLFTPVASVLKTGWAQLNINAWTAPQSELGFLRGWPVLSSSTFWVGWGAPGDTWGSQPQSPIAATPRQPSVGLSRRNGVEWLQASTLVSSRDRNKWEGRMEEKKSSRRNKE